MAEAVKEKTDISKVRIDGRKLTCSKCEKIIAGDFAIKKRVHDGSRDKGNNLRWKREYLCEGCYEKDRQSG